MTILKVLLVVATLSSMAYGQQAASEDLTLAASKGKRHISQLEPYGSLQFHRPPLPSIDYYGESDKGHGGYIVLSHEKGKGHKSKGKGGGGYGYDTGYSNGYAVGGGDSSENHGNGGGSFGGSYYVAKIKGKGKGGYPSKGKGGSYGGKGKGGYGKGKGGSYGKGKGKGSYGDKGKGGSYGSKGKGGSYGGKGQGGIPYGSGGYNPYGGGGGGGSSENNGNGGYLYVSGAISNSYGSSGIGDNSYVSGGIGGNSYGGSGIGGNLYGGSGIGGILHENSGIGGNSHGSSGIEGNSHGSGGIGGNSQGSSGSEGNSYGSTGIGFGSSQSGGSSSENSGALLSAYGGGGLPANFYAGGGTQDSTYGGGGAADNYGLGGIDGSYAGGGIGDSYGGGGVDESYGIGGTDDLYGGGVVDGSYGDGGVENLYGGGEVDDSFGGGVVGNSYGTGGIDDSYGTGGIDDSQGGGVFSYGGSSATGGGGSEGVGISETSAIFTRGAGSGRNTGAGSRTGGSISSTGVGSQSLGGGGEIAESTGRKRSPPDTNENADKLSESNATNSNKSGRKAITNNDSESNAKATVNYNLSINTNGDASAANGNGNNNTVKVDIKTDGKAENAFSVSVHISSGGNGNSPSVRHYASPTSPPIVIQPSSVEEVDSKPVADEKVTNSGGSSPGTKRSITSGSKANQETLNSGEKSKKESKSTPEVTKEQVKDNKPAKPILPVNNPIKLKAPDGNPDKSGGSKTIRSQSSTSAKPGSPGSTTRGTAKIENVPQQVKGRNETRTNRTTTPLPLKNTAGSGAKVNATEEQSSIGCTSGCFSIPPVVDPSIRGQGNNSTKLNSSINNTPGRTRNGREHVTTNGRKQIQSPASNGTASSSGKPSTSKDVLKGKVQAEVTSGIAIKGNNTSGITGKDRMRLIGSTASFININGGGNDGFESAQHLKHGGGRRNVGTANSTHITKHTGIPTIDDIHSFFVFGGNGNKDSESLRPAHKNETKATNSSTNVTTRPVARHNLRSRPTTVTPNTTSSTGIKKKSTKGSGIGETVPTAGGKRNATFPIDVRRNVTLQAITQRPRPAVDILSHSGRPTVVDVPLGVAAKRGHRGLDTIGNGTKSSLKTKNEPNGSPVQFSRYSPTSNPIPVIEDEHSFLEHGPTNAGKHHRGQVSSTASVRDQRAGAKGNSNPSVEAPTSVPFLPVDTYYIPLRRFIRQMQTQWP